MNKKAYYYTQKKDKKTINFIVTHKKLQKNCKKSNKSQKIQKKCIKNKQLTTITHANQQKTS